MNYNNIKRREYVLVNVAGIVFRAVAPSRGCLITINPFHTTDFTMKAIASQRIL